MVVGGTVFIGTRGVLENEGTEGEGPELDKELPLKLEKSPNTSLVKLLPLVTGWDCG